MRLRHNINAVAAFYNKRGTTYKNNKNKCVMEKKKYIMQEKVLEAVKLYEAKCSGKDVDYVITEVIEDESEGAALYLFESEKEGIKSAAFAYESGEVFLLTDWQGSRPEKLSEVADYDWVTISGHDAINLNGYPRKFC